MSGLEEVEMAVQGKRVKVIPPHDDEQIIEDFIRVLGLEGTEGSEREGITASGCHGVLIAGWL